MSALIPNTSDDDLNDLEDEYMGYLNELKALFPEHAFYNNPYEDGSSYDKKQEYDTTNNELDSRITVLDAAITKLEQEIKRINGMVNGLKANDNSVTKKDVLTPEQMISDKVDIYNFHKLNIFIRAIGIAGLLFLFKLKFKGNIKNPLVSSNSN